MLCFTLHGCMETEIPSSSTYTPVYPEGPRVDENGHPIPAQGWGVISFWGVLSNANYYNTGGPWYIIIDNNQISEEKFTQVYVNKDPADSGNCWIYIWNFRISSHYIYIDDPTKAFLGWTYYVIVYDKYHGL